MQDPEASRSKGGSRDVDDLISACRVLVLEEEIGIVGSFVFSSAVSKNGSMALP